MGASYTERVLRESLELADNEERSLRLRVADALVHCATRLITPGRDDFANERDRLLWSSVLDRAGALDPFWPLGSFETTLGHMSDEQVDAIVADLRELHRRVAMRVCSSCYHEPVSGAEFATWTRRSEPTREGLVALCPECARPS